MTRRLCDIEACSNVVLARGWCPKHYQRWRTLGDPQFPPREQRRSTLKDVWSRFVASDEGCWPWHGPVGGSGYGTMRFERKKHQAHRLIYELLIGPIPDGLDIDHLCSNKLCVNPDHLEPVTRSVNIQRAIDREERPRKTACPQGHPFDESNTIVLAPSGRRCRLCRQSQQAKYRERKHLADKP